MVRKIAAKILIVSMALGLMLTGYKSGLETAVARGDQLSGLPTVEFAQAVQAAQTVSSVLANIPENAAAAAMSIEKIRTETYYTTGLNTSDTLYWINGDQLSSEETILVNSLMGIVAQTQSQIYLYYKDEHVWFEALREYYGIQMIEIKGVWSLVDQFKSHIKNNGYVRFRWYRADDSVYNSSITDPYGNLNTATMIAGQERYVIVGDTLRAQAEARGLVMREDATGETNPQGSKHHYFDQLDCIDQLQDTLNQHLVLFQNTDWPNMRDIAIALKMAVWKQKDAAFEEQSYVLERLGENGLILGWFAEEYAGVKLGGMYGWATAGSDTGKNFSVFAGLKKSALIQKPRLKNEAENGRAVHYVCFSHSDGDAPSYAGAGKNYAEHPGVYGASNRGAIPMGWTTAPENFELAQIVPKLLYSRATANDEFIAGISGMGYMMADVFKATQLNEFAKRTAEWLSAMNMPIVQIILDPVDNMPKSTYDRVLGTYARYDAIKGGYLYYQMQRYVSYSHPGAVYWVNDKPFVDIRESLWGERDMSISGTEMRLTATADKENIISRMAYRINNYPKTPNKIDGYTFVNVHTWTYSYDDVVQLVGMLGPDVVVVTPSQMIELIAKNVPHVDANPDQTLNYAQNAHDPANVNAPAGIPLQEIPYPNMPLFKYESTGTQEATDRLSFDFSDHTTQGWIFKPGSRSLESLNLIKYSEDSQTKYAIRMVGTQYNSAGLNIISAGLYNTIDLAAPKNKITISYTATGGPAYRVKRVDGGIETIISSGTNGWVNFPASSLTTSKEIPLSLPLPAGQTQILIEFQDAGLSGSDVQLRGITIS